MTRPLTPSRGPSRLRLAIKPRFDPPRPYAWEVYDEDGDRLILQSARHFQTFREAWDVGTIELEKIQSRMFTSVAPIAR